MPTPQELWEKSIELVLLPLSYLTLPSYQAWGFLVLATYLKTIYPCGSSKTKYPF